MHFSSCMCYIGDACPSQLERHPKIFEWVHFHFFALLFHLMHSCPHRRPSCVACCPLLIGGSIWLDCGLLEPWTQNLWFLEDSGWIKQITFKYGAPCKVTIFSSWLCDGNYASPNCHTIIHDFNNTYEIRISVKSIWLSPLEKRIDPIINVQTHYL